MKQDFVDPVFASVCIEKFDSCGQRQLLPKEDEVLSKIRGIMQISVFPHHQFIHDSITGVAYALDPNTPITQEHINERTCSVSMLFKILTKSYKPTSEISQRLLGIPVASECGLGEDLLYKECRKWNHELGNGHDDQIAVLTSGKKFGEKSHRIYVITSSKKIVSGLRKYIQNNPMTIKEFIHSTVYRRAVGLLKRNAQRIGYESSKILNVEVEAVYDHESKYKKHCHHPMMAVPDMINPIFEFYENVKSNYIVACDGVIIPNKENRSILVSSGTICESRLIKLPREFSFCPNEPSRAIPLYVGARFLAPPAEKHKAYVDRFCNNNVFWENKEHGSYHLYHSSPRDDSPNHRVPEPLMLQIYSGLGRCLNSKIEDFSESKSMFPSCVRLPPPIIRRG